MGKLIYRNEKVNTASECSGREAEANRTEKDIGRFENSDIDWELTRNNIDLVRTDGWVDAVKAKCKELGCPVKKDSVLIIDHLVTASPEWMKEQTKETQMQFFNDALDWIVDEFCGGDRSLLLNARIHCDEPSNIHMCVATIPIVKNEQRSEEELAQLKRKPRQKEYSLNAKKLMGGPAQYGMRQQSIEDRVGKKYGLDAREVREPGQAKKHRSVQQAKLDGVKTELTQAEQERDDAIKAAEKAKEGAKTWSTRETNAKIAAEAEQTKLTNLKGNRERLQGEVRELRQSKVEDKKAAQEAADARKAEEQALADAKTKRAQEEAAAIRAADAHAALVQAKMQEADLSKEKRKDAKKEKGLKFWEKLPEPVYGLTNIDEQELKAIAHQMRDFFKLPIYLPEDIQEAQRAKEQYDYLNGELRRKIKEMPDVARELARSYGAEAMKGYENWTMERQLDCLKGNVGSRDATITEMRNQITNKNKQMEDAIKKMKQTLHLTQDPLIKAGLEASISMMEKAINIGKPDRSTREIEQALEQMLNPKGPSTDDGPDWDER